MAQKISKNFLTITNYALRTRDRRRCWKTCRDCGCKMNASETQYAHMKVEGMKTYFICDKCADKYDSLS